MDVDRDQDVCGATTTVYPVIVNPASSGLRDAVVVIEGIKGQDNPAPLMAPVVLSNANCRFSPHIVPLRVGTTVAISNEDPIMHNTHIKTENRTWINVAMVAKVRPILKKVETSGLYSIRCDAHKFMRGYAWVFDHPFFAVSDDQGYARIRQVPSGTHDIVVWHETLGRWSTTVTVPPNGETTVTVLFPDDGRHQHRIGEQ